MLPTEDAVWVGEELARRFGLPYWQFAVTATDANRFALRLARHITGRPKILVFNWCYHGTVDETFATLGGRPDRGARRQPGAAGRPGRSRPGWWSSTTCRRSRPRWRTATSPACSPSRRSPTSASCTPSPASTPRSATLTRRAGTLLIIDETHTICAGPGGYTRAHGLEPDIADAREAGRRAAFPARSTASPRCRRARSQARSRLETADTGGIGGTLAANALATAAMRATLEHVLTDGQLSSGRSRWPSASRRASRRSSPRSGCPGS